MKCAPFQLLPSLSSLVFVSYKPSAIELKCQSDNEVQIKSVSLIGFLELPENIRGMKSLEVFDASVNPLGS